MPFSDLIGHERPILSIQAALEHGRLAHAYLFHGEAHIGKALTATRLAQALNCEHLSSVERFDSCGTCRSCLQIAARTFPDYVVIEPDHESAVPHIKIEQIRDIEQQLIYRPLIGERKICLIDDADRLTIGAANALLKTLEEPPGHALFMLISSRPQALPITIRSRCQALRFTPPTHRQVETTLVERRNISTAEARFLALYSDRRIGEALALDIAALRAQQRECLDLVAPATLQSITAVLTLAESLAKADRSGEVLDWLGRWIRDLVIILVGGDREHLLHLDDLDQLNRYAEQADPDILLALLHQIERTDQQATRHLNMHMALETILLRLREGLGLAATTSPA
ncbi:MAG: DNA polymerase III subunit delta' [Nitrospira sp.]|nr:DNA polymerase III subunit delta' [Nitrospira sp.]